VKDYAVFVKVDRQVATGAFKDIQLIVLQRSGGPSDSVVPRYYMGSGKTRKWALLEAQRACREHGGFEPRMTDAPVARRQRIPA
jgi:hypothetical protein